MDTREEEEKKTDSITQDDPQLNVNENFDAGEPSLKTSDKNNNGDSNHANQKTCRICFTGVEEQIEFGRLISPCKCKGTMKYVHLGCLNQWREMSRNQASFFKCDQCHFKYNFKRTFWAGILCNKVTVAFLTILIFIFITFISGFAMKLFLKWQLGDFHQEYIYHKDHPLAAGGGHSAKNKKNNDHYRNRNFQEWLDDYYGDNDLWGLLRFWLQSENDLSLTTINVLHFILGTILLGIIATFKLFYYFSYPARGGFGGLFGPIGGGRRNNNNSTGSFILLFLVLIGIFKVLKSLYEKVNRWSQKQVELVESAILDINE